MYEGREDLGGVLAEVLAHQAGEPVDVRVGAEGARAFLIVSERTPDGRVVHHAAGRAGSDALACRSMSSEPEFRRALRSVATEDEDPDDQACLHAIGAVNVIGRQVILLEQMWWTDREAHDEQSWSSALVFGTGIVPGPPRVMTRTKRLVVLRDSVGATASVAGVVQSSRYETTQYATWESTSELERKGPGQYELRHWAADGMKTARVVVAGELLSHPREAELLRELLIGHKTEVRIPGTPSIESPNPADLLYTRIEPPQDGLNVRMEDSKTREALRAYFAPDGLVRRIVSTPDAKLPTTARVLFIRNDCDRER